MRTKRDLSEHVLACVCVSACGRGGGGGGGEQNKTTRLPFPPKPNALAFAPSSSQQDVLVSERSSSLSPSSSTRLSGSRLLDPEEKAGPLLHACARQLLGERADASAPDGRGVVPLFEAAVQQDSGLLELLVRHGAEVPSKLEREREIKGGAAAAAAAAPLIHPAARAAGQKRAKRRSLKRHRKTPPFLKEIPTVCPILAPPPPPLSPPFFSSSSLPRQTNYAMPRDLFLTYVTEDGGAERASEDQVTFFHLVLSHRPHPGLCFLAPPFIFARTRLSLSLSLSTHFHSLNSLTRLSCIRCFCCCRMRACLPSLPQLALETAGLAAPMVNRYGGASVLGRSPREDPTLHRGPLTALTEVGPILVLECRKPPLSPLSGRAVRLLGNLSCYQIVPFFVHRRVHNPTNQPSPLHLHSTPTKRPPPPPPPPSGLGKVDSRSSMNDASSAAPFFSSEASRGGGSPSGTPHSPGVLGGLAWAFGKGVASVVAGNQVGSPLGSEGGGEDGKSAYRSSGGRESRRRSASSPANRGHSSRSHGGGGGGGGLASTFLAEETVDLGEDFVLVFGLLRSPSAMRALLRALERPPVAVPDLLLRRCMECKEPFSEVRWRHHCRHCARLLCHSCSSRLVPASAFPPGFDDSAPLKPSPAGGQRLTVRRGSGRSERVCDPCMGVLALRRGGRGARGR